MKAVHKNSIKRKAIMDALCQSKEHPTAEMIYETLKPMYPDLSLGTVYRNLSMFCKEGNAVSVGNVNGKERFDGRTDIHSHFVCGDCGRVLDVDMISPNVSYEDIMTKYGCEARSHSLVFTGVCNRCRE